MSFMVSDTQITQITQITQTTDHSDHIHLDQQLDQHSHPLDPMMNHDPPAHDVHHHHHDPIRHHSGQLDRHLPPQHEHQPQHQREHQGHAVDDAGFVAVAAADDAAEIIQLPDTEEEEEKESLQNSIDSCIVEVDPCILQPPNTFL